MMVRLFGMFLTIFMLTSCSSNKSNEEMMVDFHDQNTINQLRPILIAHRGGVVTDKIPACTIAAIEQAKKNGYAMVELDVRQSKDQIPFLFHDGTLKKSCGIDKNISELLSQDLQKINFLNSDHKVITLEQALSVCQSLNLGVMLDVKIRNDESLFKKIVSLIKKYDFTHSCITINGDPLLRKILGEIALLTVSSEEFINIQQGESVNLKNRFWFGLPSELPSEMVPLLQQNGAYVIPAINTFRYPADQHFSLARKDIHRLIAAGVDGFQIDSIYQPVFEE